MRNWKKAGLVVALALALCTLAATQDRDNRGYNDYSSGQYGNNDPAYQYGYKDGFDLGANAARTGAAFNDHGSGAYNHADNGFPGGDKASYQQRYRQAYTEGYRAGYQQVQSGANPGGQYGPNGAYRKNDPAYQYGYKDGFDLGTNAARTGAAFNDHGSGAYNHADNGFPGGDKASYQQRYRQAYTEGYRAGYQQVQSGANPGGQYGPNGAYRNNDPAYQYGYGDGFNLGANAARTNAAYNDHAGGAYDHADNGFPGGDKASYQQRYRQAYTEGYRAGYEQIRGQSGGVANFYQSNLQILRAEYGAGNRFADVTARLNSQIQGNQLNLRVTNDTMGGDPAVGQDKALRVQYAENGREGQMVVNEGDYLKLPANTLPGTAASGAYTIIPSGTQLAIRTNEVIDSKTTTEEQRFSAVMYGDVLNSSGTVAIPKGSDVELVIRSTAGSDLVLDIDSLVVAGQRYVVSTSDLQQKGGQGIGANRRTAVMVGGGAAVGALIGAIVGGGKGAAIGAGVGAAGGAGAEVLTKGKEVRVPAETVLNFKLDQDLSLEPVRW